MLIVMRSLLFFFFNDTATTEIYTLSLHDALPIFCGGAVYTVDRLHQLYESFYRTSGTACKGDRYTQNDWCGEKGNRRTVLDRKSTRLNSSHANISYAVFCLKKKNN